GKAVLAEVERIGRSHGLTMLPPLAKPFRAQDLNERLAVSPPDPSGLAAAPAPRASAKLAGACQPVVDLDEALRHDWLELWYQPKIDLRSLSVCGAEALLRARHPERGVVLPCGLLPSAGDPLYRPLTRFVIRRAMTDWGYFAERGLKLKLALNVP